MVKTYNVYKNKTNLLFIIFGIHSLYDRMNSDILMYDENKQCYFWIVFILIIGLEKEVFFIKFIGANEFYSRVWSVGS